MWYKRKTESGKGEKRKVLKQENEKYYKRKTESSKAEKLKVVQKENEM